MTCYPQTPLYKRVSCIEKLCFPCHLIWFQPSKNTIIWAALKCIRRSLLYMDGSPNTTFKQGRYVFLQHRSPSWRFSITSFSFCPSTWNSCISLNSTSTCTMRFSNPGKINELNYLMVYLSYNRLCNITDTFIEWQLLFALYRL